MMAKEEMDEFSTFLCRTSACTSRMEHVQNTSHHRRHTIVWHCYNSNLLDDSISGKGGGGGGGGQWMLQNDDYGRLQMSCIVLNGSESWTDSNVFARIPDYSALAIQS